MTRYVKALISLVCIATCVNSAVRPELVDKADKFLNSLHSCNLFDLTQAAPWAEAYKTAYTGLEDKTISTLSGDVFSPSQHSRFNRGGLFGTLFNVMKIDVAGPGDHEFDFGVERFLELQRDYSFDWVLSNLIHVPKKNPVTEPETGKLLQKIKKYKIVEKNGFKIGFFGLFDKKTFLKSRLARTDLEIEDPIQTAVKVSKQLRDEKCDLVVLLSHMDSESDIEVLNAAGNEIDLAFGGHNRKFRVQLVNNRLLLKSGHNFIDSLNPRYGSQRHRSHNRQQAGQLTSGSLIRIPRHSLSKTLISL